MASYTEHYQLHQWEPEDPFLRTDFNDDFKKIDTALGRIPQIVVGTYAGTENVLTPTTVNLGFRPSLVIITQVNAWEPTRSIMLSTDNPLMHNNKALAEITDTGFLVGSAYFNGSSFITPHLNAKLRYCYIAFS